MPFIRPIETVPSALTVGFVDMTGFEGAAAPLPAPPAGGFVVEAAGYVVVEPVVA